MQLRTEPSRWGLSWCRKAQPASPMPHYTEWSQLSDAHWVFSDSLGGDEKSMKTQ